MFVDDPGEGDFAGCVEAAENSSEEISDECELDSRFIAVISQEGTISAGLCSFILLSDVCSVSSLTVLSFPRS